MRIEELAKRKCLKDWPMLINEFGLLAEFGQQWVFRGQEDSKWFPQTTLERAIEKFSSRVRLKNNGTEPTPEALLEHFRIVVHEGLRGSANSPGDNSHERSMSVPELEDGLLRRFKRQCHHYLINTPEPHNLLEWFALMRHHGAPTRLLDWTYSFFVLISLVSQHSFLLTKCGRLFPSSSGASKSSILLILNLSMTGLIQDPIPLLRKLTIRSSKYSGRIRLIIIVFGLLLLTTGQ
jgi:hypothetical protein